MPFPSPSLLQALRTPANILVVNLALSDLIMLTTNVPFFTYNCFSGGVWMFSPQYCEIYACLGESPTTLLMIYPFKDIPCRRQDGNINN